MTSYLRRAQAALDASKADVQDDPNFLQALAHVRASELERASAALVEMDDPGLVLATMFLERLTVRLGHDSVAVLSGPMLAQVPANALDYGWIARRFEAAWSAETAGHVDSSRVAKRDQQGGFANFALLKAVETLVAAGKLDEARQQLSQFGAYDKGLTARAHAIVGLAASDDGLFSKAVDAARKSPMIQDGGEEAAALGEVLKLFADGGLSAAHPAVTACVKALVKLGNKRARKDVRSYGLRIGALAAAVRGGAWTEHAEALLDKIWSDELKHAPQLALASHRPPDEAELLRHVALEDDIADLYPAAVDDLVAYLLTARGPLDRAALLRKHGRPSAQLVNQAVSEAQGYWQGIERIWGHILLADQQRANELFEAFDANDAPELALQSAAVALATTGELERAADYFRRALKAGFFPRYGSTAHLMLQVPALISEAAVAAADVRDRAERMESLSLLAQLKIELGDWDGAASLIGIAISGPAGEEEPDWTPWSMRGDRAQWTPVRAISVPATTASKQADAIDAVKLLPKDEQLNAYWKLAHEIAPDALTTLRSLMAKAPGGRGDAAQVKRAKLVEVCLIGGLVDDALTEAQAMRDCRASGWGPAYTAETIAAWFAEHPEHLSLPRANAVLSVMESAIPQDIPHTLATVVANLAPALAPADQPKFIGQARAFRGKFRRAEDATTVDLIAAMGEARCRIASAREAMSNAVAAVAPGIYTSPVLNLRILRAAAMLDEADFTRAVLTMPSSGRVYAQCMVLERAARIFWDAGIESPLPALLREGAFATEVTAQTRRSLVVMAPECAPEPVDAVLSVWLDAPPNRDQAIEQINALAAALRKSGKHEDAAALAALG